MQILKESGRKKIEDKEDIGEEEDAEKKRTIKKLQKKKIMTDDK